MTTTTTTRPEICEGVRFLDTEYPEWLEAIDLETFDLESAADCVLGQLAARGHIDTGIIDYRPGYSEAMDHLTSTRDDVPFASKRDAWAESRGFTTNHPDRFGFSDEYDRFTLAYAVLTAEWVEVIEAKRAGKDDGCE